MTEPIAECTFVLTEQLFLEGMGCTQRKALAKTMKWAAPLLAVLWLVISGVTVAASGRIGFALGELAVIAAVFVYAAVWLPHSRARRAWNAMEAKGQADGERTMLFFADHLRMDLPGRQMEMDYAEIAETLESKNLLILISRDRTGMMIKKEDLVGCGCDALLRTITENGGL